MFFLRLYVLSGRDDGSSPACRDGGVAGAIVIGTICGDHPDALAICDLVQQVGRSGRVADIAAGDLDGPDFQRCRVDA